MNASKTSHENAFGHSGEMSTRKLWNDDPGPPKVRKNISYQDSNFCRVNFRQRRKKDPLGFALVKFVFLIKQYCVQSSQQNFESSEGTK